MTIAAPNDTREQVLSSAMRILERALESEQAIRFIRGKVKGWYEWFESQRLMLKRLEIAADRRSGSAANDADKQFELDQEELIDMNRQIDKIANDPDFQLTGGGRIAERRVDALCAIAAIIAYYQGDERLFPDVEDHIHPNPEESRLPYVFRLRTLPLKDVDDLGLMHPAEEFAEIELIMHRVLREVRCHEQSTDPMPDTANTSTVTPRELKDLERNTPKFERESGNWIAARKMNEKLFGLRISTLAKYRLATYGGAKLSSFFGVDKDGRRWRRAPNSTSRSTAFYFSPDVKK